jgi:UDP-N-acetylmuramate--alanine ligase
MFRKHDTHIHFVGMGGIGMSGIAEVLLDLDYRVTGTDLRESETLSRLRALGASALVGHRAEHLGDADVVVVSSAVPADNPEVVEARRRKIPVIQRAEMLAELGRLKQGLFIAGSHGKTTTTSLVASAMHHAGLDPTVVIGGKLNRFESNARLGHGEILVAEADESDGSFLCLSPAIAIVTNIDDEHLDHYGGLEGLLDAFVGFANRVPFWGMAIVCIDDPNIRKILPRLSKRTVTYGFDPGADYVPVDVRQQGTEVRFRAIARGEDKGEFVLHMPGRHNVLNALATIALCDEQQVHVEITREALSEFSGVQRRFTVRAEAGGIAVVDDYAHHPTEVRATLAGARGAYPDRRIVAAFQPHRYTRVRDHLEGFAAALDEADVVVLTDVYAAGETPIPGVDAARLCERLRARRPERPVEFVPGVDELAEHLATIAREGDVVLTLGAGSITRASFDLAQRLAPK